MPIGPCPYCSQSISIERGQPSVTCGACGAHFEVVRREGRIRLRPADAAPSVIEPLYDSSTPPTSNDIDDMFAPLRGDAPALVENDPWLPETASPPAGTKQTFLLDPRNAGFARGKTRRLPTQSGGFCTFLFLIPFLIVGIAVPVFAIVQVINWQRLDQAGVVTQGQLVKRWINTDDDGDDTYYVSYGFRVNDQEYTGRISGYSFYSDFEAGRRVDILYEPANPGNSTLAGHNAPPLEMTLFMCVFGGFWNLITYAVLFSTIGGARRLNRINRASNKQFVRGEIIECKGHSDSDDDFWVTVRYHFSSPKTGKVISGKERRMRNDLSRRLLPARGTPVQIVYVDDNLYQLL